MGDISSIGVVGTDNQVPIYRPDDSWRQWAKHEVFFPGGPGAGRYVPKVNDYVKDVQNNTDYIVDHLDPVTLFPTLRQINPNNINFNISDSDRLFGVGNSAVPDTALLYVDHSHTPGDAFVDMRRRIPGSESRYARVFRTVDGVEKVISARYDNSGNFIDDKILLETVGLEQQNVLNYAIRSVPGFKTNEHMADNEIVTLVVYTERDVVAYKRQLLVVNTRFIPKASQGLKFVTHISLESPFLSKSNPQLLEYPLNLPLNAMNLTGVVHYSDGSEMRLPVDGKSFEMGGLDQYLSTIVGETVDLTLWYNLATGEQSGASVDVNNRRVSAAYQLSTINPNNSYAVKLYGFPVWVDSATGYKMEFWLYNLDRNTYFNVTSYVRFAAATGTFNPKGYGYLQRRTLELNLRDVSPTFKAFIHTQSMDIELLGTPADGDYPWRVSHVTDSARPSYGVGIFARRVKPHEISIASNFTTKAEWLKNVLERNYPLMDPNREIRWPEPTHVIVEFSNRQVTVDINDWNKNIEFIEEIPIYQSIRLRFVRRSATSGWIHIGMASMVVKP